MEKKLTSLEALTWLRRQLLILAGGMAGVSLILMYFGISTLPTLRRLDQFLSENELSPEVHIFVDSLIKAVKVSVYFFGFGGGGMFFMVAISLLYMRRKARGIETIEGSK